MNDKHFPTNMQLMLKIKLTPLLTLDSPLGEIPIQMTGFEQVGEGKYAIKFSTQDSEIGQMVITAPAQEFQKLAAIIHEFFRSPTQEKGKKLK